jgi:hypothetical protein
MNMPVCSCGSQAAYFTQDDAVYCNSCAEDVQEKSPIHVSPSQGGCWYCQTIINGDDIVFDTEFDTFVHLACIRKAGKEHPEAKHQWYLLGGHDV